MKCKITGEKINSFISFGQIPAANGFLEENDFVNKGGRWFSYVSL